MLKRSSVGTVHVLFLLSSQYYVMCLGHSLRRSDFQTLAQLDNCCIDYPPLRISLWSFANSKEKQRNTACCKTQAIKSIGIWWPCQSGSSFHMSHFCYCMQFSFQETRLGHSLTHIIESIRVQGIVQGGIFLHKLHLMHVWQVMAMYCTFLCQSTYGS